ncbi:MAG TPA: mechanosensitive ion channel family protein, partial [Stellaceae bacterium]|nr:mechanosensitive ion channel family protein [Stellaceae bacterium]
MKRAAHDLALQISRLLGALALIVALAAPLHAASPPAPPADQDAKVRELLKLLDDPQVQAWIKSEAAGQKPEAAATPDTSDEIEDRLAARFAAIRAHLKGLLTVIPELPSQFQRAFGALSSESAERSGLEILGYLLAFLLLGLAVEWLFKRATTRIRLWMQGMATDTVGQRLAALSARFGYHAATVIVFGIASLGVFLIFDWPPLLREILLLYLIALVELRLTLVAVEFLLGPRDAGPEALQVSSTGPSATHFWRKRIVLAAGWFAFGYATVFSLRRLGFDFEAGRLVAYILGLGLLAIALDVVWHRPVEDPSHAPRRRAFAWLYSVYCVLIWALWVSSANGLMWFLILCVVVPWAIASMQRSIAHLARSPHGEPAAPTFLETALKRGLRALIVIVGALFLVDRWNIDLAALISGDTPIIQLVRGLVSSVVIIIIADFGWQIVRTAIDRKIMEAPLTTDTNDELWRRQARIKTLLPIMRNLLLIVVVVMVALMVLASLGVNIGPLIAGASVVGVAIGFGAQTLVRDIISGMFYLLDDAFRVGEYIQSGNFKGTVESFSLRSVKLRHHRGPVYTVPFGVLGAVQNMSRDWVIDKLSVGVTYDTDLGKVKKIMKDIGKQLQEDPDLKPKILETLKMQGVEQFGDYAIQIR